MWVLYSLSRKGVIDKDYLFHLCVQFSGAKGRGWMMRGYYVRRVHNGRPYTVVRRRQGHLQS